MDQRQANPPLSIAQNPNEHGGDFVPWKESADKLQGSYPTETGKPEEDKHPFQMRGYWNLFRSYTSWQRTSPRLRRKAAQVYDSAEKHYHRDRYGRAGSFCVGDHYLHPESGKLKKLVVQCSDEVYASKASEGTWDRTFIRNVGPWQIRVAAWPTDSRRNRAFLDLPIFCFRWLISCVYLSVVALYQAFIHMAGVIGATLGEANANNQPHKSLYWKYDAFPYAYFGYPKASRNVFENRQDRNRTLYSGDGFLQVGERALLPHTLCFLDQAGFPVPRSVEDWLKETGSTVSPQYLLVTYTSKQFHTNEDLNELHRIAANATREAGLSAFWTSASCMKKRDKTDVYRICDYIRGAHSVAIIVGQSEQAQTTRQMLEEWGSRIWTFPEVLLSPRGKDIKVFIRSSTSKNSLTYSKNHFAMDVWKHDKGLSRQLIDHFEGNLILGPLELASLALKCLTLRETTDYFDGDRAYALAGLQRVRPDIDPTDSGFQAFARLSLANDSNRLLERLLCMLPKDPNAPWHVMDDAYDAHLWDIYTEIQVSGVGDGDTVVIDGCHAAGIQWMYFQDVKYERNHSITRQLAAPILPIAALIFWPGIALFTVGFVTVGLALISLGSIGLFAGPLLLRFRHMGKFRSSQPRLFGFEGYLPVDVIEKQLFGANFERLSWSPHGSPLSRHRINEYHECIGYDPTQDPAVAERVLRALSSNMGDPKVFTLVDTYTMTVMLFEAVRPPVALVIAGSEGGMQRALACSYDWMSKTLVRETVLRVETRVLDCMSRLSRARFGFISQQHATKYRKMPKTKASQSEERNGV